MDEFITIREVFVRLSLTIVIIFIGQKGIAEIQENEEERKISSFVLWVVAIAISWGGLIFD